jgi:hypothetical protein
MCLALLFFGLLSSAVAQYIPTISGVNAFWWLGSGILYDGGGCLTIPQGACYYAQSTLTSNANGAPGTPTWSVYRGAPGGNVSLSCTTCTSTVATATAPSYGCTADVTIYVSYGGYYSAPFNLTIVTPSTFTVQSGYPTDSADTSHGYISNYVWNLTDSCGYSDPSLDGHETFGTFYTDYTGTDWPFPTAQSHTYRPDSLWYDAINAFGQNIPLSEAPQSPLTSTKVLHDTPWSYLVGTQTQGSGVVVQTDTQQFYQDHGRHQ